jgi:hypothetical protein
MSTLARAFDFCQEIDSLDRNPRKSLQTYPTLGRQLRSKHC